MQLCVVLFYSHPCTTLEFEVFFVSYDQTSLKVRYRELDIFKILGILWEFFWRRFFGGIILEEFFARNFSEEDFGKIFFRGIIWDEFFVEFLGFVNDHVHF